MSSSSRRVLLIAAAAATAFTTARVEASVINVAPGPGTPLQDAIDAASPGDVLRLGGGIFNESVVVDKPLKLTGTTAYPAIINGGCGAAASVEVASDGVKIDNVAVNGAASYAVNVVGRDAVTLNWVFMQSQCAGAEYGVSVFQSSNVKIARCDAVGFDDAGFYIGGIAPDARVKVMRGSVQLNVLGVLLEDSAPGIRVRGVRALNNSVAGISLRNSDGALVASNEVSGNPTGIAIDASSDESSIRRNRLSDNGIDGDDQGTSNCWRGNRNPTGAALTGNIPTTGCP
jgi:parallel beta-helix repeat protein